MTKWLSHCKYTYLNASTHILLNMTSVLVVITKGFSKDIKLPRSAYLGYIKDYEGATLMEVRYIDNENQLWEFD